MSHSRAPDTLDVPHPIYQSPSVSLSLRRSGNSPPKENLFQDIQLSRYQRSLCYGLCHIPYKYTLLSPYHVTLSHVYFSFILSDLSTNPLHSSSHVGSKSTGWVNQPRSIPTGLPFTIMPGTVIFIPGICPAADKRLKNFICGSS